MNAPVADTGLNPLESAAVDLSACQTVSGLRPISVPVWRRIAAMRDWLDRARRACVECDPEVAKAAEWLLDNDYQVERAIRQIRHDLPDSFYRRLPALASPADDLGLPRIYALAHGLLRASRLQLSLSACVQFVRAYQQAVPLTIAELWALPTTLRLACLEILVAALGKLIPDLDVPFDPTHLALEPSSFDDTECVARALANLAAIATIPWKDFFEQTSLVEAVLATDPAGVYSLMDFETRDDYRKAIEELAEESERVEADVAGEVVRVAGGEPLGSPARHVGHWLVDEGRCEIERILDCRPSMAVVLRRSLKRRAAPIYAAALAFAAIGGLLLPALYLWVTGAEPCQWAIGMTAVLVPATLIGVTAVNWAITQLVPPRVLGKLDFDKGIPTAFPTAVVIPVIINRTEEVQGVIERLEGHRLANPDTSLRFALLSDHGDAPSSRMPDDEAVEQALIDGIRRLNRRYGGDAGGPFHLLHRVRNHSLSEGCWMGWERKRGKLEQFNRFVLGEEVPDFAVREGDTDTLRGIRFVVTADADTMLPPGSVARLVGTIAHPLNSARFDEHTGRVRAGYTVIQPRVEISPERNESSLFARLYAGDTAIDIYSRAVSDVYQDLFGTGIFVGKGIYEVKSFHRSLAGRVPENSLVSHDLFEGIEGRSALATDIVLYEAFPGGYLEYTQRLHRWIRGDWQLLPWLGRRVPAANGSRVPNRLSALDRWKIFDNLRRSLVSPALLVLLVAGWLLLPGSPWVWTALAVAAPGAHLFTDLVTGLARGRRRGAVRGALNRVANHAGRWLLALVFLVQDAVVATDAILRALWRMFVSRQRLLEWVTAAHVAARMAEGTRRPALWRRMWPSPIVAAGLTGAAAWLNPPALIPAAPLLILWLAAPEVAAWTARVRRPAAEQVTPEQSLLLRRWARRTWLYFERFVGPEDHWLPPDNYQEEPHAEIAHRTSPTNIGMMFVSSLTAWDLGFIGPSDLLVRVRAGLDSLDRLERYRGHFFNWYDTRSLQTLEPRYVSTVDSGNLAVSLLTLSEGCREAARGPALRPRLFDGLADTLRQLRAALSSVNDGGETKFAEHLEAIIVRVEQARDNPDAWQAAVADLAGEAWPAAEAAVGAAIAASRVPRLRVLREIQIWLERVRRHIAGMRRDIDTLLPWSMLIDARPVGSNETARTIGALLSPSMAMSDAEWRCMEAQQELSTVSVSAGSTDSARWLAELDTAITRGADAQKELSRGLLDAATRLEAIAYEMDFRLVYDSDLRLFHIGYNVSADRTDPHHYDLLATEARLASFFAIAKRDVPIEHWFHLGRPVMRLDGGLTLVSWNGSMFEYLMPPLFLRSGPNTLLGQSEVTAVDVQRRHAEKLGTPWGTSESAFASRDPEHHYRYRAFGVPSLGLRRGLSRDNVVAPYASALALPFRAAAAIDNLIEMERLGLVGLYGFYEAADFTDERVPAGSRFAPVRAYMAHHQGMILAAVGNALSDDAHVRRLGADRHLRSMALLLHERIPWEAPSETDAHREVIEPPRRRPAGPALRAWQPPVRAAFPQVNVLGNGSLASWISDAGAGGLSWHGQALTRWQPDATCDDRGLWIYVRDEENGALWSAGRQPVGAVPDEESVIFHAHMAEFHRRDHGIALHMDVAVVPGDDIEVRRITVINESDRPRTLALTSYGEVVLAPPLADERHLAFSKLFVGAEFLPRWNGLLFSRRPRHPGETPPVLMHRAIADREGLPLVGYEADRRSFIGRGGSLHRPHGVVSGLTGTVDWTLDPVMALQVRITLDPNEDRQVAFLTIAAGSRETAVDIAERYAAFGTIEWTLNDASAHARDEIQRLGLEPDRLPELQMLLSLLIHPHPALRADPATILGNQLGQTRLWGFGLSGDWPILLVRVTDVEDTALLAILIRAHMLWRRRGIHVDLVILRIGTAGYLDPLRERILGLLRDAGALEMLGHRAGIHFLSADQVGEDGRRLLESVARIVLDDASGPLAGQVNGIAQRAPELPRFEGAVRESVEDTAPLARPTDLVFDNGYGGFSADGGEYVIYLKPGESTPAPWCNVLANDHFGTIVTEVGGGFTWSENSGENRLTSWSNDPVTDAPGEAVYLRDEETAAIWTPTPQPAGSAACVIRHGAGYSEWQQRSHGLEQSILAFVPGDEPVKIVRLRLANLRPHTRRITTTYYAEWLLGALGSVSRPYVVCEYEPACHALLVRNPWSADFADRVGFLTASRPPHGLTADRQEFLGREGSLRHPAALERWGLSGKVEAGDDSCAAFQVHLDIDAGATAEVVFILGQGANRAQAEALARRWQDPKVAERAFEDVVAHWDRLLGAIRVNTPDPAFDLMANRWLLYQTIASRVLARASFYQAGGAFGFRDQLQDMLAVLHVDPARVRAHILAAAARQFEEGDVLHWWHPPADRGVRTRCSDDLLWLPYVVSRYVEATGDDTILDETVAYLHAEPLHPEEHDRYDRFQTANVSGTLFEHCERALRRGITRGAHGLPLIGTGDWNDGMDRLGRAGRGESVWLAWFAIATMKSFAALCTRLDRDEAAAHWREEAEKLARAVEASAWDGEWYLRAFDDDGRPLGSKANEECRIDSISQSWAALSGSGSVERSSTALDSAARELIRENDRLIRLLWPPFDATPRDPGYIKAYPPGVRENGGQYTHAAAWLGLAFIERGDGDRAFRIFDLINPIGHAASRSEADHYRLEPYVIAADVASVAPHLGRGGWSWYTGSAAWTWRLAIEGILGVRRLGGGVAIAPCLPREWAFAEVEVRGPAGTLAFRIENSEGSGAEKVEVMIDGLRIADEVIKFPTDGAVTRVLVRLPGSAPASTSNALDHA